MEPMYIDTETVGLHGVVVLIQYAEGNGDIHLFSPWENEVWKTIELIERFANHPGGCVFFNAAFDWFMLYKMWTMWKLAEKVDPFMIPEDHIEEFMEFELKGRDYPDCLKPVSVLDLFLHARKGPYQSTMDRKDVRVRRVPTIIAGMIAKELEQRVPFKDIYFARRKDKFTSKWQVDPRKDMFGDIDPEWKDIIVRFKPSSALKTLAVDALGVEFDTVLKFGDISPKMHPVEFGYVPIAKIAMGITLKNKAKEKKREGYKYKKTWPDLLKLHIIHWGHNELAREYARKDIVYTRALRLHKDFINAEMGDDDSVLACQIACSRWRGYTINIEKIKKLRADALEKKFVKINNQLELLPTAPAGVKKYLLDALNPTEQLGLLDTKKLTLEKLVEMKEWYVPCEACEATGCSKCRKGYHPHKVQIRAKQILDARKSEKEVQLYDKLLAAGRLHASFKVIGTLSSRMSGADGLNPQGMNKATEVKETFIFAQNGYDLAGGDFDAYEITIAEAEYKDEDLRRDLLTCEKCKGKRVFNQKKCDYLCEACGSAKGLKIHALFGVCVYTDMTYEEIKATDGKPGTEDKYTGAKQAVFQMIYGGDFHTMMKKLNVDEDIAKAAEIMFKHRKYPNVGKSQNKVINAHAAIRQPGGIGSQVEYHQPNEKIETFFGFARWFTLENRIVKAIYDLASRMPKAMTQIKMKVVRDTRRSREQTASGAASSALYGAAFGLQGYMQRAAINHVIQGTGAQITKMVQRKIWDIQPAGAHKWIVQPLNIHDSIMTPILKGHVKQVAKVVKDAVESVRDKVPLIKMPWQSWLAHWADKGGPIVSVDPKTKEIVKMYKDRRLVIKEHLKLHEVARCMSGHAELYNGLQWRPMTKEEMETSKG